MTSRPAAAAASVPIAKCACVVLRTRRAGRRAMHARFGARHARVRQQAAVGQPCTSGRWAGQHAPDGARVALRREHCERVDALVIARHGAEELAIQPELHRGQADALCARGARRARVELARPRGLRVHAWARGMSGPSRHACRRPNLAAARPRTRRLNKRAGQAPGRRALPADPHAVEKFALVVDEAARGRARARCESRCVARLVGGVRHRDEGDGAAQASNRRFRPSSPRCYLQAIWPRRPCGQAIVSTPASLARVSDATHVAGAAVAT
jgi:hypothetical protein